MSDRPTLAVVVTIPGRPVEKTIASLRGQVDRVHLYLNGFYGAPPRLTRLVDEWKLDPRNVRGAAAKFAWADRWDGMYLACDDDLAYPPDYAATMRAAIAEWDGRAIVTTHGRILRKYARAFEDQAFFARTLGDVPAGRWLNYPGACAIGFDTRLGVPVCRFKNNEEVELALWAQGRQVPIWLVPHAAGWIHYLLPLDEPHTIWNEEVRTGFVRRNAPLEAYADAGGTWQVFQPVAVAA